MAKADDTTSTTEQWVPFAAVAARAGSLEELLVPLREEHIFARAADFFVNGNSAKRADRNIPSVWCAEDTAHDIDPTAGRAVFKMDMFNLVAIGIEIERGPVDALWPVKPETDSAKKPERQQRPEPQQHRIKQAMNRRWPDGMPDDIPTGTVRALVCKDLQEDSKRQGLANPSWDSVNRALGRGKKK